MNCRSRAFAISLMVISAAVAIAAASTSASIRVGNERILYERIVGPNFTSQIATVDPAGHDIRLLTHFGAGAREAQWAPRGGRLVFARQFRGGSPGALFTMRANGERLKRLSSGCRGQCLEDFEPTYSSDGQQIVFDRAFGPVVNDTASEIDLMIMRRNGSELRTLMRFANLSKRRLEPHNADFSPDDRRLAFMLLDVSSPAQKSAIFIYDFETADLDRVTPWRLSAGNPDWSHDGRRLLFNSNWAGHEASDLFTSAPDGTHLRRLTSYSPDRTAFAPTWSPSGHRVAFSVASRHVPPHAVVMRLGGEQVHRVTSPARPGVVLDWG